jgi:hypothetical protein
LIQAAAGSPTILASVPAANRFGVAARAAARRLNALVVGSLGETVVHVTRGVQSDAAVMTVVVVVLHEPVEEAAGLPPPPATRPWWSRR